MGSHSTGLVIALALLAACGSSTSPGGGGTCTPTATQVCMLATSFNPTNLAVPAGTTVTWSNPTVTHTVTSATGSPGTAYDSGNIAPNGMFTHSFSGASGTVYHYYCKIHGSDGNPPNGMAGTITIQ